jgi:hypothetical protein
MSVSRIAVPGVIVICFLFGGCHRSDYSRDDVSQYIDAVNNVVRRTAGQTTAIHNAYKDKKGDDAVERERNEAVEACDKAGAAIAAIPTSRVPLEVSEWGKAAARFEAHMAQHFRSGGAYGAITSEANDLQREGDRLMKKYR